VELKERYAHEDEEDEHDSHYGESITSLEISCFQPSLLADTEPICGSRGHDSSDYLPRTKADRAQVDNQRRDSHCPRHPQRVGGNIVPLDGNGDDDGKARRHLSVSNGEKELLDSAASVPAGSLDQVGKEPVEDGADVFVEFHVDFGMWQTDKKVTEVSDKARYKRHCRRGKERYDDLRGPD